MPPPVLDLKAFKTPRVAEFVLICLAMAVAGYICFEFDIFLSAGDAPAQKGIELNETLLLGGLLMAAMLVFCWRRVEETKSEAKRRLELERAYRALSSEDPLTGLANRRKFNEGLETSLRTPTGAGLFHAMMLVGLGGLDDIRDAQGQSAGDRALLIVTDRIRRLKGPDDIVAKFDGDEFAILTTHLVPEAATGIALRVIESLSKPVIIDGVSYATSVGVGICIFPFPGCSIEEVARRAEMALRKAKAEAEPTLRFFDEELDRHIREREQLEIEFRRALSSGGIQPFFQPIVSLESGEIVGFETLARWPRVDQSSVSPDRFIPVAEHCGLIQEMTERLLREACEVALTWPRSVTLAFNISPSQMRDRGLGLRIMSILAGTGLPPERLEIEITESALVRDLDAAREVLGDLRSAGIRIALDDFGTGYSSLFHLRSFKPDKIKIDRSFVANMRSERASAEIVGALLGLAHGLGLVVTAEGIEDPREAAELLAKGCQQGQGFLYSRAVSGSASAALFASSDFDSRRIA